MTYEDVSSIMIGGSASSELWRARESFVTRSAWPSVLQDRESKDRERQSAQISRNKPRTNFIPKFRPPSAPNPRLRHSQQISRSVPELEPASDQNGNTKDCTTDQETTEISVCEKIEAESPSAQRSESRLSRTAPSPMLRETEETLQNPQAVTDPLICKSRMDSSFKMFRLKTWKPYPAANNDTPRHTCRIRPSSSRYRTREAVLVKDVLHEDAAFGESEEGENDHRWRVMRRPRSVPPHLLKGNFNEGDVGDNEKESENNDLISTHFGLVEASSPILSTQALSIMSSECDISCRSTGGAMRTEIPENQVERSSDDEENKEEEEEEDIEEKDKTDRCSSNDAKHPRTTGHDPSNPTITVSSESQIISDTTGTSSSEGEESDEEDEDSEVIRTKNIPSLDLPPEHFETEYGALSDLPDPVKFDFEVSTSPEPAFNFPQPLPEKFQKINFRRLAEVGLNWRQVDGMSERNLTEMERALLDRVVDLERLQINTEQIEQYRRDQLRRAYRDHQETVRRLRSQGMTPSRIASATRRAGSAGMGATVSTSNRQCCSSCLQPACAGDCPNKTARPKVCILCRQVYCDGSCAETTYAEHQRSPSNGSSRPLSSSSASALYATTTSTKRFSLDRPKSCNSCRVPTQAFNHRLINANSIVLGRPDCQRATFTSGEHSKKPMDYRPPRDSPAAHGLQDNRGGYRKLTTMIKKFESLGMSPTAPPPRIQRKRARACGRNGIEPGKTRISCRRDSLTSPITSKMNSSSKSGPPFRTTR